MKRNLFDDLAALAFIVAMALWSFSLGRGIYRDITGTRDLWKWTRVTATHRFFFRVIP